MGQGRLAGEKWLKQLRGQGPAMHGQRDAVAGKGINKAGRIARQQHSARFGLRPAKVEWCGGDCREERLPLSASAIKIGLPGKYFVQRARSVGTDHGTRVDRIPAYRLDATVTAIKEI